MPYNRSKVNVPVADFGPDHPFTGAEIVSSYSRAEAIEDGVLVDVTAEASKAGWRYPVAVTAGVWGELVAYDETPGGDTKEQPARLREILHMAATVIALQREPSDTVRFPVTRSDGTTRELWGRCGPGDRAEPVVTIMLIGED